MRDLRRLLLAVTLVVLTAFGLTRWWGSQEASEVGSASTTTDSTPRAPFFGENVHPSSTSAPGSPSSSPSTVTTAPAPTGSATSGADGTSDGLAGAVIVLDPGHNGGNASHPEEISRLVDIGNGLKECNTTGTATDDGYAEWEFNFDVAQRAAALLRDRGATVVLTHTTTDGWGPCSVERAAIANRARADAAVSIHADGGPPGGRGFHVLEPASLPGLTDDIVAPSHALALALRDAMMRATPLPVSDYIGTDGIMPRTDLGGLNRADVPAVFVECANMRNAADAALVRDPSVRQSLAEAIVAGLEAFLSR